MTKRVYSREAGSAESVLIQSDVEVATGETVFAGVRDKTFQASIDGTGAVAGTVLIEVSNDTVNWLLLATITLSGTTTDSDGFASSAPWKAYRSRITAISGTDAVISVSMGY